MFLKVRLNSEMQILTYDHGMLHINNGDYDNNINMNKVESERHTG